MRETFLVNFPIATSVRAPRAMSSVTALKVPLSDNGEEPAGVLDALVRGIIGCCPSRSGSLRRRHRKSIFGYRYHVC
jgi:hypothetical protein